MFSSRTNWPLAPNRLAVLLRERRERGLPITDLTESNPTRCGLALSDEEILGPLRDSRAVLYQPDPRGPLQTREAVAEYYARRGVQLDPEQIFLASSTSEAYSFVFRLLANPGDKILSPGPSYPLFEFLGALNDIEVAPYPLAYHDGWQVDLPELSRRFDPRTRAVLVVHPNNPTGSFSTQSELGRMNALCREGGAAIIADEVFADYARGEDAERVVTHAANDDALTFTLSGLSKIAALPQMKLGWMVVTGPEALRREAINRLEVIADTYLSVSAPVALAGPSWLASSARAQSQILDRVRTNLQILDSRLAPEIPLSRLKVDGGWYAILKVPATRTDEDWAAELLTGLGISIHPGHFYDFPSDGFLVLSLLPVPEVFADAICRIISFISGQCLLP
jgi:aspartate/methionine/tyrosine aminotransferase